LGDMEKEQIWNGNQVRNASRKAVGATLSESISSVIDRTLLLTALAWWALLFVKWCTSSAE